MNLTLILASILFISISSPLASPHAQPDSGVDRDALIEWQTLTKQNFSSQIQLPSSILLIVTVPWCGESLSLMRDISHVITQTPSGLEGLKLMRLYRNKEKMLADSLGAGEDITIIYYYNFVRYKYRGRLRAGNIVKSIVSMGLLEPTELPLKSLNTHEELLDFIESTDKAVVLHESCGWTSKLLNTDSLAGTPVDAKAKFTYSPILEWGGALKVAGHKDAPMCDIHNSFYGFPSFEGFSSSNDSASSSNMDDSVTASGSPCNSKEFELFGSFLTKFINSAREMFLPIEKQRFGFISERALIASLGTNESRPWSLMLNFAGCPECTKTYKEGDDLDNFLQKDVPLVTELEDDGHRTDDILGNNPSLILFVDRSSNLSTMREASKIALKAFRELALSYHVPYGAVHNSNALSVVESSAVEAPKKTLEHPKLELSPISQRIKASQKMSIVIMDGEKRISIDKIASDLQGSSLQKLLDQIVRPAKGSKLSLVAKEAGFQLLSDDLDIHVEELVQKDKEISYDQPLPDLALESSAADSKVDDEVQPLSDAESHIIQEEASVSATAQHFSGEYDKVVDTSLEPSSLSENCHSATVTDNYVDGIKYSSPTGISDETSPQFKNFEGNFYFSDGGYRLLRSLTGGSKLPSLVIIDPTLRTHYVLEEDANFDYSHLVNFLDRFTNKILSPYHRSESSSTKPGETTLSSQVKTGFHVSDSIPKVSAHILSNILKNIQEHQTPGSGGDGKQDMLVLFSNSWCAFCQKMELVVREVYHALMSYEKMLKDEPKTAESSSNDDRHDSSLKTPLVYTIDCTLNDCSAILESTGQIEAYPTLLLFPGDKMDAVTYDGNIEVSGIIRFLADRGSYSSQLVGEKGILWTKADSKENDVEVFGSSSSLSRQLEIFNKPSEPFEVQLISSSSKHTVKWDWIQPEICEVDTLQPIHRVTVGSILLATSKLLETYPFDQSKILIVKADKNVGYQGLILNKHINWNSFQELSQGSETLTLAPLSLGGPVIGHENPLVALTLKHIKNGHPEVIPDVYFLDQSSTALEIAEIKSGNRPNVSDYWFFLGYSSWGWEQLHNEIAEKAWKVTDDISTQFQWP